MPVRGIERAGELLDQEDRAAEPETAALEDFLEVWAFDEAHGDVEQPVGLACVVNRNDVGVVDRRGDVRLSNESLPELLVPGELGREDLEGDLPAESHLLGDVDDAHAAAAEHRFDSEPGDLGSNTCVSRHFEGSVHYLPLIGENPRVGRHEWHDAPMATRRAERT
jgi:hypothetical protein